MTEQIHEHGFWVNPKSHITSPVLKSFLANCILMNEKLVYDLGCGFGAYCKAIKDENPHVEVIGFEGQPSDKKVYDNIQQWDLTEPRILPKADVLICLEVGEHIPAEYEDILLDNIANNGKFIIMSWAVEGQAGVGHVNCRNNDYIIQKMADRGKTYNKSASEEWRSFIDESTPWFKNTLMVFN